MSNNGKVSHPQHPHDEFKRIVKTKKIRAKKRLEDWVVILQKLEAFDSITDKKVIEYRLKTMLSSLLIAPGMCLVMLGLEYSRDFLIAVGIPATFIGFFIWMPYYLKLKKYKKDDVENDFRVSLLPFLQKISDDILPNGEILLDLDIENAQSKKNMTSKMKIPPGDLIKIVEIKYAVHCCRAIIPLVDRSLFVLDINKNLTLYKNYMRKSGSRNTHCEKKWEIFINVTTRLIPVNKFNNPENKKLLKQRKTFKYQPYGAPNDCVPPEDLHEMYMKTCEVLKNNQKKAG